MPTFFPFNLFQRQPAQPPDPERQRIIESLNTFLDMHPEAQERIAEQVNVTTIASSPTQEDWYWGRIATGGEEDYYWRRLSDNFYQKDTIPSTYLEIHNQMYEAYNANPLAFAIVEMTTSFVIGKGVSTVANEESVQEVIKKFWEEKQNHMSERIYALCTELSLYGEQFIRYFVNPYDGSVVIRQIDPSVIDQVETDPDDIEKELRFHRRPIGPSASQPTDNMLPYDDPELKGVWFEAGKQVDHFAINKVSNAKRGKGDLATLLPWLRRYKDWLTDRVRINKYKGAFLWDVTLKGADAKVIRQKKMEYSYPPEPGTVIIHNEAEVWNAVKPEINAGEAEADGRAIKLMVAVGALIPEHYLSDGSNGTRATASEMGLPTFLKFKRRQMVMANMLRTILDRVIEEAIAHDQLPEGIDTSYDLIFPELDVEDNVQMASAAQYFIAGLTQAAANGWVSRETAMKIMFAVIDEENIDIEEELGKIEKDMAEKAEQMQAQAQAQAQQNPVDRSTQPKQEVRQ